MMQSGYLYGAPMPSADPSVRYDATVAVERFYVSDARVREACADIESFLARLARAERERDEALAKLAAVRAALGET